MMTLKLEVLQDPQGRLGSGSHKTFDKSGGSIGRDPKCDFVLPDQSLHISGQHALIQYLDKQYYITDTSTNGLFLNHDPTAIGKGNTVKLLNGDHLLLGKYEFSARIQPEIEETLKPTLDSTMSLESHALANGAILFNQYQIMEVLGEGAFGVTYLANDVRINHNVAIKEYLPLEFATRDNNTESIKPLSADRAKSFDQFKIRFLNEAKSLAQFRHSAIVRVLNYFEANNTAYLVMEYEEGQSLRSYLAEQKQLDESAVCALIRPLLDGLETMHEQGLIHRDIKPGNIYIRKNHRPVLLDFGAARQMLNQDRNVTALYTPGYAPVEQYYTDASNQGPWTDIYAMAAVIYEMITGRRPVESNQRAQSLLEGSDIMSSAQSLCQGQYSENFLIGVDQGLGIMVKERPQSVCEWKKMLLYDQNTELDEARRAMQQLMQENAELQKEMERHVTADMATRIVTPQRPVMSSPEQPPQPMHTTVPVDFTRLLNAIQEMVNQRRTGSILIKHGHDSAVIALKKGVIISLAYGGKQGLAAIPELRALTNFTFRLSDIVVGQSLRDLPPTTDLLALLTDKQVRRQLVKPQPENQIDIANALKTLESVLQTFVGPVAGMIMEENKARISDLNSMDGLHRLVKRLAQEIPEAKEYNLFIRRAKEKLK